MQSPENQGAKQHIETDVKININKTKQKSRFPSGILDRVLLHCLELGGWEGDLYFISSCAWMCLVD